MTGRKSAIRKLSALLAALMVLGTLTALPVFADSFSDISSHWAKANVEYMVDKEIISGYPDGTFRPDNTVTRAEFIKMLDATFGLTETAAISFSDVSNSQWYYPYIQQAAAQGYLLNYGSTLNPNGELTREEAAALLARYLNLAEKDRASVSFTDAASINQNYRGYVYACVDAGIIKGYDTGDFKPQRTLTRAEAMAILYRSAGSIYRGSAVGAENGAQAGNATITKGGSNISNASFSGSVYITEGAGSSTVTLSNCNIRGTLYLRGNSRVQLAGSTVNNVVVIGKSSATVGVNLDETSTVTTLDAQSPVSVYLQSGSTVSTMNVGEHAESSSVSGAGTVGQLNINGAKFKSDVTPRNYTIGDRLTAEIGGQSVGGSGTSRTGVKSGTTPVLETSGSRDTLTLTPNETSVLFWYYTNSTAAPSSKEFADIYRRQSSNVKGFQSLDQVQSYTLQLVQSSIAAQYNNVVICLLANQEYFDPIILSRTGANNTGNSAAGFKNNPTVKTNSLTNLDTLSFMPEVSGTMYYYYTTSPTAVTAQQFRLNYDASAQGLRGNKTVIAGNSYAETTSFNPVSSGSNYNYVAVMLTSGASDYQPIVVTRNAADGGNLQASGLADAPVWSSYNGNESLRINASAAGTLKYYYTNSSQAPNASTFNAYYGMAGTYYNAIRVSQGAQNTYLTTSTTGTNGTTTQTNIKTNTVNASGLGYIVIMLTDGVGNNYAPYVVARQDNSTTGGGFSTKPSVSIGSQNDTISFTPSMTGYVFWYYTTSSGSIPAGSFMSNWNNAPTSARGQSGQVQSGVAQSIMGGIADFAKNYSYIVVSLQDTTGAFQEPVTIARTQANTSSYGFRVNPTVAINVNGNDTISLTPQYNGTVYYYYSNSASSISGYSTFESNWNTSSIKSSFAVNGGSAATVNTIASASVPTNLQYVVIMLRDSNGTYYSPITVRRGATNANVTGTGLTAASLTSGTTTDLISVTASANGTVKFYYTTSAVTPSSADFDTYYNNANSSFKSTISVTANQTAQVYGLSNMYSASYPYVVMMLETPATMIGGSTTKYQPVVITRGAAGINNNVAAGFTAGPVVNTQVNGTNYIDTIAFTPSQTGTVYFLYTNTPASFTNAQTVVSNINNSNGGTFTVTANTPVQNQINTTTVNNATAVIFVLATTAGYSNPVTVYRNAGMNTGTNTNSGYGMSKASLNTITGNVEVRATVNGYLYYYYTNSATVNMTANDMRNYGTYTNANTLGDVSVPGNNGYAYVWLMMYDGMNSYAPYRVQLSTSGGNNGGTGMNTNSGSGFKDTMTVKIDGNTYFTYIPNANGRIYYYVSNASTNPGASNYMYSWASASGNMISDLKKDTSYSINLSSFTGGTNKYLIIQFVSSDNTPYTPQVITLP